MGVPGLYRWLIDNFCFGELKIKGTRYVAAQGKIARRVDHLFIDGNAFLHPVCQIIFKYGEHEGEPDMLSSLSYQEKLEAAFELFFVQILQIVGIMMPKKVLYIAIDGTAPIAKQAQQRERRMTTIPGGDPRAFSSNFITPGTPFMFELTKYMNFRIRSELSTFSDLRGVDIIFSPPTVPGEGEHKCMDFIRRLQPEQRQNDLFAFCGPDGDLIMLTLACRVSKIFLMRESFERKGSYDIIDMSSIKYHLAHRMHIRSEGRFQNETADDFILLGFFVGNDFLPRIKAFQGLKEGIQRMIDTYSKLTHRGLYLTRQQRYRSSIDFAVLLQFIAELAVEEKEWIYNQRLFEAPSEKFVDRTLLSFIDSRDNFDYEGWTKVYYEKAGVKSRKEMATLYVIALWWIFEYYANSLPSWEFFYPYHYAPLLSDIVFYRDEILETVSHYRFEKGRPSEPFEQLLTVLPPRNSDILPYPLRWLMLDPKSPLASNYPDPATIEIDFEGKDKEFLGVSLLPYADIKLIRSVYAVEKKKLRKRYVRNELGRDHIFRFDPNLSETYVSSCGVVIKNRARRVDRALGTPKPN